MPEETESPLAVSAKSSSPHGNESGAQASLVAERPENAVVPSDGTGGAANGNGTLLSPTGQQLRRVFLKEQQPELPETSGPFVPWDTGVDRLPAASGTPQMGDQASEKRGITKRTYPLWLQRVWLHRGIWLGLAALIVCALGQVALFQIERRGEGAVLQVLAMVLAAVAWSGLRDAKLLTPDGEPRRWLHLVRWRRGLALRLAGIALSLILLWLSFQAYYGQPDAFFGPQGYLWLASMAVLLGSCARWYTKRGENTSIGPSWTRYEALIFAAILGLSLFTHLSWLNEVPWVIDVNEYTAWKETMRFYRDPPSISMFTTTWLDLGLPSLWFWFQAWPMRVFGDGLVGLRYITGLTGAVTVIPVYLLARMLWGRMAAVFAGFSVVFLTVILHNSRQSSNNIATGLWWTLCFYFMLKGLRSRRPSDFVWAGLWAGTSMYTYYGTRLLPYLFGIFLLYLLVFHRRTFVEHIGHFALVAAGFMVGFGPLFAYFTLNPLKWAGRGLSELVVPLAIPAGWDEWVRYWDVISAQMRQNFLSVSVIPAQDTFFFAPFLRPVEAVILLLGLGVLIWRWRQPASFLILLWAGSTMAVASLIDIPINPNPNFTHWAPAWPVFFLALALPPALFLRSLRRLNVGWWRVGATLVSLGFVWIAAADFYFYLVTYPPTAPAVWPVNKSVQSRFLASVEPSALVRFLGCCTFDYEYGEAFTSRTASGELMNASRQLPLVSDSQHDQIFYLPGYPNPYMPILKYYYPIGRDEILRNPESNPAATIYHVTPAQLTNRYGVQVTVTGADGKSLLAKGQVSAVGVLPAGVSASSYPVVATWSGEFYVNNSSQVQLRVDGGTDVKGWLMSQPGMLEKPATLDAGWVPFVVQSRLNGPKPIHLFKSEGGAPETEVTTDYLWPDPPNMGLMVSLTGTLAMRVDPFVASSAIRPDGNYFLPGRLDREEAARLFRPLPLVPQLVNGDALGRWAGELYAEGGAYTMELNIDGRAQLIIDGTRVINSCAPLHSGGETITGQVTLTEGWHKVELTLQTNGPGGLVPRGIEWTWTRPDGVREVVPPTRLRYSPTITPAEAPVWPPPPAPVTCEP